MNARVGGQQLAVTLAADGARRRLPNQAVQHRGGAQIHVDRRTETVLQIIGHIVVHRGCGAVVLVVVLPPDAHRRACRRIAIEPVVLRGRIVLEPVTRRGGAVVVSMGRCGDGDDGEQQQQQCGAVHCESGFCDGVRRGVEIEIEKKPDCRARVQCQCEIRICLRAKWSRTIDQPDAVQMHACAKKKNNPAVLACSTHKNRRARIRGSFAWSCNAHGPRERSRSAPHRNYNVRAPIVNRIYGSTVHRIGDGGDAELMCAAKSRHNIQNVCEYRLAGDFNFSIPQRGERAYISHSASCCNLFDGVF